MVYAKFDLVLMPISHGNPAMPFEKKSNLFLIFENGVQFLTGFKNGFNQLRDHNKRQSKIHKVSI